MGRSFQEKDGGCREEPTYESAREEASRLEGRGGEGPPAGDEVVDEYGVVGLRGRRMTVSAFVP